jgi:hypothetical protein
MTIWPTVSNNCLNCSEKRLGQSFSMPVCGAYLVWPGDGTDWIHPEDIEQASRWIPSLRVFRRHSFDGEYYRLQYGDVSIRVRPSMWHRVDDEGFSVGDQVEVLGRFQENEPCIARILEIRFDKPHNRVLYTLEARELPLPRSYVASDLNRLPRSNPLDNSMSRNALPSSGSLAQP